MITDADLHLLPLALSNVVVILETNPESVDSIKSEILPVVFQLVQSPLIQGSALAGLLKLFAAVGKASPGDYSNLIQQLINPVLTVNMQGVAAGGVAAVSNKHASSTISQCVAMLATTADAQNRETTINEFENFVKVCISRLALASFLQTVIFNNVYRIQSQMTLSNICHYSHWAKLDAKRKWTVIERKTD